MAAHVLDPPVQLWGCECGAMHRTRITTPHTPMHSCPLVGGVTIPYAPAGREHRGLRVQHWDDYQRSHLTTDDRDGRPVTAVHLDDGNVQHTVVYPSCATTTTRQEP